MLCQVFYRDEKAEFPETKAGLYELFVRYFYEWKPTLSSVDWTTQLGLKEELHQALGRLSIAGLDSDARFRLPESLIKKELDDRLFKLAWELGWLNLVDREAKTDEPVYAFFHPTFQEYFAALAIDDWRFFLNHVPENPDQGNYRIFESQWKEIYLLWLGLNKIQREQKESLIKTLLEFQDGWEYFFAYRAYFLVAIGIAEFSDFSEPNLPDEIVEQLVTWSFGCFNTEKKLWMSTGFWIRPIAQSILRETAHSQVITALTKLLKFCSQQHIRETISQKNGHGFDEMIIGQISSTLLEFDSDNEEAIKALNNLINTSQYEFIRELAKLDSKTMFEMIKNHLFFNSSIRANIPNINSRVYTDKDKDIERLFDFINLKNVLDNLEPFYFEAIPKLDEILTIVSGDTNTLPTLIELIKYLSLYGQDNAHKHLVITLGCLQKVRLPSLEAVNVLKEIIHSRLHRHIKINAIWALIAVDSGNQEAFNILIELAHSQDSALRRDAIASIPAVLQGNLFELAVANLKIYLQNSVYDQNPALYDSCDCTLWYCAQNMNYPDFYRAWHNLPPSTHPEAPDNIPVGKSSITQNLNFTQLPSNLDSEIANDEELNKAVKLICIDGSYFSDPNNPATDIYIEMVEQGCPEKQEEPNTMQQLKKYWRLDLRKLEKRIALLFYNSKNDRTLNPSFLSDIATFGGTIAIISDEHCNNVRLISPNDPNLIDTALKWLKREIKEA